jgi:CubicO group peptidase (beta-lactamase class C family)
MVLVADLTARRLETVLARAQHDGRVPSLAAAVVRDGSVVWRGSRGDTTGAPGLRPAELQYRVGSITKTMTAVLVLQLRDGGLLSLADPVSAYLPEVPDGDRTLRSLLAHSSGIPAEPPGEWWERVPGRSFPELVAALEGGTAPFPSGTTHHYSNVGFALLGEVVARVTGRSWWEAVSDRVLSPLGMLRTSWAPFDRHAQGYSVAPFAPLLSSEPAADTGAMAPAGQVWSTVLDLATYAQFLVTGHEDVLPLSTLEEMSTPQAGASADGLGSGYGLGLRLVPGGSGTLVGHTGSMPGFQASLFVDRPRRAGAVALANSTTGLDTDGITPLLLDVLEESEPSLPEPWTPVDTVPEEVTEVLGVWHWGNTAKLFTWDGSLLQVAHALTGEPAGSFRLGADGFVGAAGYHHGEPLEVVRRDDGSVSHLVCSTFVHTRTPYDPAAPIPGGPPAGKPSLSGPG